FFSSRRRHTRFSRDWSSDVCSSDLVNQHFGEEPILLDVLFSENHYPVLQEKEIVHSWLHQEGTPVTVPLPSFESILGDKLTAFRSEEQRLNSSHVKISYAVFCLKKK